MEDIIMILLSCCVAALGICSSVLFRRLRELESWRDLITEFCRSDVAARSGNE